MSSVTFELPSNFVHTPHTVSQSGTSDERQQTRDTTTEWYVAFPSAQTAPIGVVEATVSWLLQEMRVFLTRNEIAAAEIGLLSPDTVLIGQPLETTPIRMRIKDVGIGKSIMTFDIDDLSQDYDELF